ncbi:S-adenosylmethionine:tRNA ribosyltransferase-isomerase [Candidatus Endomicrobiellum trichonymphae]|uniref:S-adenosylmethionine:tRNA ribosyltransferase-isomerase n=1 Tax=Endomicrobium trichonymphae TaxID=1408204 RepID=UPI0039B8D650
MAVGTTSVRALESTTTGKVGFSKNDKALIKDCSEETSIFIYPDYKLKIINTLVTNLNIPKLTPLIIMASAFSSREIMLKAYKEAVKKYRFFSYGDSMLIL